jgi:diguanylate cyclase (GGDEF)-like protein
LNINKVMSRISTFYRPTDSLLSVVDSLADKHHSCGLICDGGIPVGIITERDIVRLTAKINHGELKSDCLIGEVMTEHPISINADTPLSDALAMANERNLRHFPVLDPAGTVIGVVTHTDMVKAQLAITPGNSFRDDEDKPLQILSIEDPLTGLPNRRAMAIDLRHCDAILRRKSRPYAVTVFSVDYLQEYSDEYGESAADKVLVHVAELLHHNMRGTDKTYRYDNEEFLFLMPDTNSYGSIIATERLRNVISSSDFKNDKSPLGRLTISAGIAINLEDEWKQTVEYANSTMRTAKSIGPNMVYLHSIKDGAICVSDMAEDAAPTPEQAS